VTPKQRAHRTHIDVLVASWRRPELLKRALASLDRVSKARAASLCLHVHVIDEEAGSGAGPAAARNLAAAQGEAEFIALLDDDDQWTTNRLIRSVDFLRSEPELALVCGDMSRSQGRALQGRLSIPTEGVTLGHRDLTLDCFVCTSTVTLRRSDWEQAGGMSEELQRAEDYDLWLRLTREGRKIRVLPDLLGHYGEQEHRLSDDSIAMVRATREVLSRSARLETDRAIMNRLGRLDAVIAHGLARAGRRNEARAMALQALREAPTAPIAWTALGRSLASHRN
jgi:glycosyltransferase involved in cell wall biosynthesis